MKTILLIVLVWGSLAVMQIETNKQRKQEHQELREMLRQRTHLDSLYWNHLEQCSYFSRDNFRIGHNNYVQYKPERIGK